MNVGYSRVSTADQSTNLQTDALKAYGCKPIFKEKASGAQRDRPQLKLALEILERGDVLVVWKLDRLARSLRALIETVDDLDARGIGFVSLTEKIDTTSAGGRMIFHIFGAMGQMERDLIRERTKAGLKAARDRGAILGRPTSLSKGQVAMARTMKASGDHSMKSIARELGVHRSTLYRVLA
ncbi:MAG: recombinase family protein [Maricaulis sp.]|nr:recombinase family protein [Maricaulis sp.]